MLKNLFRISLLTVILFFITSDIQYVEAYFALLPAVIWKMKEISNKKEKFLLFVIFAAMGSFGYMVNFNFNLLAIGFTSFIFKEMTKDTEKKDGDN